MPMQPGGATVNAKAANNEGSGPDSLAVMSFVGTVAYLLGSIGFFDLSVKSHLATARIKMKAENHFYNQLIQEAKRQSSVAPS